MTSVAAKHARGKKLKDVIFVTAGQAQADAKENVLKKNALAILVLTALFVASQPLVVQVVFIIWYITILNLEMKY